MTCAECYAFHARRSKPTPCGPCPMPRLQAENHTVWEIFESLSGQIRLGGMGEFMGYDYSTLPMLLSAYDVPQSEWFIVLKKLDNISAVAIELHRKRSEQRRQQREIESKTKKTK